MAALATAVDGKEGRPKRTADIVVSYELLLRMPPVDLANVRCDLEGAGPVPLSMLRRLAADSALGRIIASGDGVPLELGTEVQLVHHPAPPGPALSRSDVCLAGL